MGPIIEIIAAFAAGVVTMPFLSEGYVILQRWWLCKSYTKRTEGTDREHIAQMQELGKEWNDTLEAYNKKLSKMEKRLRRHGLNVETDEDNNQIVVKKMPVKMSFVEWLKQKRWR